MSTHLSVSVVFQVFALLCIGQIRHQLHSVIFQGFFLHYFVLAKLGTSSMMVKDSSHMRGIFIYRKPYYYKHPTWILGSWRQSITTYLPASLQNWNANWLNYTLSHTLVMRLPRLSSSMTSPLKGFHSDSQDGPHQSFRNCTLLFFNREEFNDQLPW